ncbi:MAG: AhpC/TSA family protein [Alistipes sp.]|nr:AhpC/TSA family protein [Alistipes sp.]
MTKTFVTYLLVILAFCSCSRGVKFDIEGQLADNAASMVYLVVEDTDIDTLGSAEVGRDNRFRLRGEVAEPMTAFICDDNGNALAMLLTENASVNLRYAGEEGYVVEGGPINDKYNFILRRLSTIARQVEELNPESESVEEEYESLVVKYHDVVSTAITDNLDNIIGVELFLSQEARGMSAEDMRVRFAQFSPQMRQLRAMRHFEQYISTYEKTETGKPFIDLKLHTMSGSKQLADLCKGKWVLLQFWATWCEPCLDELPMLRSLYAKYAAMGFEICAVSLDRDQDRWRHFVAENEMLWTNAIDIADESQLSAAEEYGLQSIPSSFLISPEGVIVERNIFGEELQHKLEHIFQY